MDHSIVANFYRHWAIAIILLFIGFTVPNESLAQEDSSYELLPAPDIWYNSVDGVRTGVRVRGQIPGTFGDGPHRLNAGLWLGTNIPTHPVSYYLRFTEPIPSISDFGSEGSISLESLYRTGFQQHGITFNKRWQTGFNELNYKELAIGVRAEDRFNSDYLLYQQLWQNQWLYLANATLDLTNVNGLGRYALSFSADINLGGEADSFLRSAAILRQQVNLSERFSLFGRLYTGIASNNTAPEYLFTRSFRSPRKWMNSGLTRARGTIPPSWMQIGNIQVTGGPNLRGYLKNDIQSLNNGTAPLYTSLSTVNMELNYPNPAAKALKNIPVIGGLIDLRSYVFFDAGTSLGISRFEESRVLSDSGLGFLFSVDIPDYLGKSRGLVLRYDLPLWLSHPGNEESFKFRQLFGIGATISL
ncbi:hypothetical protein [Fodinibius sp. Rm-B-1B1-1]|uniref:hypothetical protein n=1 Tax=Fodinibius alkaliphilus TaxID=3140241 RepID=UPI003159B456